MSQGLDLAALRGALSRFAVYPTPEQRAVLDDAGATLVGLIENALPALYCLTHDRIYSVDDDTRCDIIPKLLVDLPLMAPPQVQSPELPLETP